MRRLVQRLTRALAAAGLLCIGPLLPAQNVAQASERILVYTRNYTPDGRGYVHQNIAASVEAFRQIGSQHGLAVDSSDDPQVFTSANLQRYDAIVFSNSNNQAFATDAQREAFRAYIHQGHGFMAVHSASGSERDWPYFQQVLGGHFAFHPPEQAFTIRVADQNFPAMQGVPATFQWTDECYFLNHLAPDIHVLMTTHRDSLKLGTKAQDATAFPAELPLAWSHTFDGSREFYIALGHDAKDYEDPLFRGILERALLWTLKLPS